MEEWRHLMRDAHSPQTVYSLAALSIIPAYRKGLFYSLIIHWIHIKTRVNYQMLHANQLDIASGWLDGSLLVFAGVDVSAWTCPGNILSLAFVLSSGLCCQGYGTKKMSLYHAASCLMHTFVKHTVWVLFMSSSFCRRQMQSATTEWCN